MGEFAQELVEHGEDLVREFAGGSQDEGKEAGFPVYGTAAGRGGGFEGQDMLQ